MLELPKLALSIQQPWAWCVVRPDVVDAGEREALLRDDILKDVENRDWPTRFRGEFCIHAGKRFDAEGYEYLLDRFEGHNGRFPLPHPAAFQFGGIVGTARLADCVTRYDSPLWFTGRYGFVLRDVVPLPLMPCRGQLGFFAHGVTTVLSERRPP